MKCFYLLIGCIIINFIKTLDSQFLYTNHFHYPQHYDPTVHKAIRRPLNFHPFKANQLPTPKPIRYGYQRIPSKGSNSIEVYHQNSKKEYPTKTQPIFERRYTFKLKNSDKGLKQSGNSDKTNQFMYIDIDVSCKYNTTKCAAYTSPSLRDEKTNKFVSTQEKNASSKLYKNDYLLHQDFMPLFDDDSDKISGKYHHTKSQGSPFQINFNYDPTETLFRHSFNEYEPNVHKYITSNMRNIN